MFAHILRPVARRALQRGIQVRKDHHKSNFKIPTYDEACHPEGNWQEHYDKLQKKYNLQLIAGVGSLVLSIVVILQNELIFFNYVPPKVLDVKGIRFDEE